MAGEWGRTAQYWREIGCPDEAALALADANDREPLRRALVELHEVGRGVCRGGRRAHAREPSRPDRTRAGGSGVANRRVAQHTDLPAPVVSERAGARAHREARSRRPRYRKTQITDRQRESSQLHKILEDTGIRLSCVASDILGKSGRDSTRSSPARPTRSCSPTLTRGQLRKKILALHEALVGRFDDEHTLVVGQILAHLDFLDEAIDRLSAAIEERIRPFAAQRDLLISILRQAAHRRGADLRDRRRHDRVPDSQALASWAKMCELYRDLGGDYFDGL
jgi:hypothetical protein